MFYDAQEARKAAVNRSERGGVEPALYEGHIANLKQAEDDCAKELCKAFRRIAPPELLAWQKEMPGIGEHLLARLVGHIGHPVHATPYRWHGSGRDERILVADEPFDRTVSQLWSYCGVGNPARKRRRGMDVDDALAAGKPLAKSLVYLLAVSCVKVNKGPYREAYDKARAAYADRAHPEACVRCGPSGRPAPPGSPWCLGHQHAAALRKVGKEILRDMWSVCRES